MAYPPIIVGSRLECVVRIKKFNIFMRFFFCRQDVCIQKESLIRKTSVISSTSTLKPTNVS